MQRHRQRAAQVLRERLLLPMRQLTGLEVFVAVMIGLIGGVFPVPLVTSVMTLLCGWCARCNAAELVVGSTVNLFCTPLQIALLPSFARLMGAVVREDTSQFTALALKEALMKGYGTFVSSCGRMVVYALFAWLLVCGPMVLVLRVVQTHATHRNLHRESLKTARTESFIVNDSE